MKRRPGYKLRLPVTVRDGIVEFEFGGPLPAKAGANAELIIDQADIQDPTFLDRMTRRRIVKLLPEGAQLLVMMSAVGPVTPGKHLADPPDLGRWFDNRRFPSYPHFIPIKIGPPLPWQLLPDEGSEGGLWLETQGNRSIQLISSSIVLPIGEESDQIKSLNHAYTVLSEYFEPHRISHTGNVYEQVLYQEQNGLWYPLKLFRDGEIADEEHAMAKAFWTDLKVLMKPPEAGS